MLKPRSFEKEHSVETREQLRALIEGRGDAHFAGVNIDHLYDEDIDIYKKLVGGELSMEDLRQWKDSIFATEIQRPKADTDEKILSEYSDRGNFAAWIANEYSAMQLEQILKDKRIKK